MNADGLPDLLISNFSSHDVSVLLGNGDSTFQPQTTLAAGSLTSSVAVADLDGDTVLDVVTSNSLSGSLAVLIAR